MSVSATPSPTLHHVTLKSTRVAEMAGWYHTVVGMRVNHSSRYGTWLTNDAANHRIALLPVPGSSEDPDKLAHAGLHHTAFEYPDLDGLLATYVRLREAGIRPHAGLDHGITTSLYYADPDGNSVELQADNFADWDASARWMRESTEFRENPIGVSFDPEPLTAAWQAGADAATLHARAFAGEFDPGTPLDLRMP